MRTEDYDFLVETEIRIRVARVGIKTPFEDRARDVNRTRKDPIKPVLVS